MQSSLDRFRATDDQTCQEDSLHENFFDEHKLDIQILLAHVLKVNTSYFYTWPEKELSQQQIEAFDLLLQQRLQGKPVAYILGKQAFWNFELEVADCTLIPRSDTEVLVEVALELIESKPNPKVIDLGTGTGAVALAIASERKDAQVEAVDLIEGAVELAKRNNQNLALNVSIYQSSWFDSVQNKDFDLIVANPPYIDPHDQHLQQGDVRFEPKTALVADNEGYADIEIIADQARQHFNNGGWLAFEHGFEQGVRAREILARYHYQQIETRQDYAGNDRVTLGRYLS